MSHIHLFLFISIHLNLKLFHAILICPDDLNIIMSLFNKHFKKNPEYCLMVYEV